MRKMGICYFLSYASVLLHTLQSAHLLAGCRTGLRLHRRILEFAAVPGEIRLVTPPPAATHTDTRSDWSFPASGVGTIFRLGGGAQLTFASVVLDREKPRAPQI